MKKFRLLAVLLAILMLPISMFVACNEEETPDDPVVEPGTETPEDPVETPDESDEPVDETVYDADGTGTGYLMFFNFDAAKRGDLRVDTKPYSTYFEVDDKAADVIYIVEPDSGKEKGALLIQREKGAATGAVSIKATNVPGISAQHTVEFDVLVGSQYLTDDLTFYGYKGTEAQPLLKITTKAICDGDGNVLCALDGTKKWVHISIAVDDEARESTIYVDGAMMTSGGAYANSGYGKWSDGVVTDYKFMTGATKTKLYAYIDNFGIADGLTPKVRNEAADDVMFTDTVSDSLMYYESTKEVYFEALSMGMDANIKQNPYSSGFGLEKTFGMYRYNETTEVFTPITFDLGVEKGNYVYGAAFANKMFKKDDNNWLYFKSNPTLDFVGMIDGAPVSGNYIITDQIGVSEATPGAKVLYNVELDKAYYTKLNADGKLDIYTQFQRKDDSYKETWEPVATSLAFDGVEYGYTAEDSRVVFKLYEALKQAELTIDGAVTVAAKEATFVYEGGKLTITADGNAYEFTYDAANDKFTYNGVTFGQYDKWECMADEFLITYYGTYATYKADWKFTAPNFANFNHTQWSTFRIRYYVPEESNNIKTMYYIDTGNSASGWSYYSQNIQKKTGWYEYNGPATGLGKNRDPDMSRHTGVFCITNTGWSMTPSDGRGYFFRDFGFIANRSVAVTGPSADKLDCTHEGTLVPGDQYAPSCEAIGYYALKCTNCGATQVDKSQPTIVANGHKFDETEYTVYASCLQAGYKYKLCTVCGKEVETSTIAATGHKSVSSYDASTKTLSNVCINCGESSSVVLAERMLSGVEKMAELNLTDFNNIIAIREDLETEVFAEETAGASTQKVITNLEMTMKASRVSTGKLASGEYYLKLERTGSFDSGVDGYFDLNPMNQMGKGVNFVYEFDIMLGDVGENGAYAPLSNTIMNRQGSRYDIAGFQIDDKGVLSMRAKTTNTVNLSTENFINIAIAVNVQECNQDLYVDGMLVYENVPFSPTGDMTVFSAEDIRFSFNGNGAGQAGASYYFNNVMFYPAEAPLCVLGVGTAGGSDEVTGDIALEKDGAAAGASIAVSGADVALKMPQYTNVTEYIVDFKLTGSLANGDLLVGEKLDINRFTQNKALLYVKDGYIFCLDRAIAEVSNAADGVDIVIKINDATGFVNVLVDGAAVPGGAIAYEADEYGAANSTLTGITFKAGSYTVSEFSLYTGNVVKE